MLIMTVMLIIIQQGNIQIASQSTYVGLILHANGMNSSHIFGIHFQIWTSFLLTLTPNPSYCFLLNTNIIFMDLICKPMIVYLFQWSNFKMQ